MRNEIWLAPFLFFCTTLPGCLGGYVSPFPAAANANTTTTLPTGSNVVAAYPSDPPSVASYVNKVKNIMTGLPADDNEIATVVADPNALRVLVANWMALPSYNTKMLQFWGTAFQQLDATQTDLGNLPVTPEDVFFYNSPIATNVHDSFGLTVQELVQEGQPFTQVLSTPRYMMTIPLMMLYAFVDAVQISDNGAYSNDLVAHNNGLTVYFQSAAVPITDSYNPNSPNYMHWTFPSVPNLTFANSGCQSDPLVLDQTNAIGRGYNYIPTELINALLGIAPHINSHANTNIDCYINSGWSSPFITAADWTAWKMVNIRAPNPGEATTKFYEIDKMRAGSELVLNNPRIGFFGTYAFQALWPTNPSNQFRVTTNQSLIVALGQAFDGTDLTLPSSFAAVDSNHAVPGTPCYGCHMTLDPMRQFFRQTYSYNFAQQQNTTVKALSGVFAWDGVTTSGNGVASLASSFANSPRFATSWTQKLCTYARGGPCSLDDPEFMRIAGAFTSSGFDFNALAKEVFSSPLVTFAKGTKTEVDSGQVVPINKRTHMCTLLGLRLGVTDPCGLALNGGSNLATVQTVAQIMPSDGYSRGAVAPTQANDPSMFLFAGMENVCKSLATVVVDAGTTSKYQSTDPNGTIADVVHNLMGIDSSRDATPLQILHDHYQKALDANATPTDALRSTFVLGCLSPSTIGQGQ